MPGITIGKYLWHSVVSSDTFPSEKRPTSNSETVLKAKCFYTGPFIPRAMYEQLWKHKIAALC